MNDVIELSTGHVFAPGSVKVVGPRSAFSETFEIIGVGFKVMVGLPSRDEPDDIDGETHDEWRARCRKASVEHEAACDRLRQEAIDKLLK